MHLFLSRYFFRLVPFHKLNNDQNQTTLPPEQKQSHSDWKNKVANMKVVIRTLTYFLEVPKLDSNHDSTRIHFAELTSAMAKAKTELKKIEGALQREGYDIQTLRFCLDSFPGYTDWTHVNSEGIPAGVDELLKIEAIAKELGVDFLSVGKLNVEDPAFENALPHLATVINSSTILNMSVDLGDNLSYAVCRQVAQVVLALAQHDPFNNFRFCASSKTEAGIPFFPTAHHDASLHGRFGVGLETGPLLESVLQDDGVVSFQDVRRELAAAYVDALGPVHRLCDAHCQSQDVAAEFCGIDASLNPSVAPLRAQGIGGAYGAFLGRVEGRGEARSIGDTGTLALSFSITQAIQDARAKGNLPLTGYSGLMLPQLEDPGLAASRMTVAAFLQQSAVCGVGLDTVALPGSVSAERLASLLVDVHALSLRWSKPLSCRVFPCPGLEAGDVTTFDSPYLCNSRVLALD